MRTEGIDTGIRLIEVLRQLPAAPAKRSARQIREALERKGIVVTLRTVQRDLLRLSSHYPICSDDARPEAGWHWVRGSVGLGSPEPDGVTALTVLLAEQHLSEVLPATMDLVFSARVAQARQVIRREPFGDVRRWGERVAVIPNGPRFLRPKVSPKVVEIMHRALLERRRFRCAYLGAADHEAKTIEGSVIGLVVRPPVTYLVTSLWDYDDVRTLALHRIREAKLLSSVAREPAGFDWDLFVQSSALDVPRDQFTRLQMEIDVDLKFLLEETPLSRKQAVEHENGNWWKYEAFVQRTQALDRWIASQGALVRDVIWS